MKEKQKKKNKVILMIAIVILMVIAILCYMLLQNKAPKQQVRNSEQNTASLMDTKLTGNEKILTVYFSESGNTEILANYIHENVGGDMIKLETEEVYPSEYNELLKVAKQEKETNARPILKTQINNIQDYDVIILGHPIWWNSCPMAILTLLEQYDFSGKIVVPFCTHGGSGISGAQDRMRPYLSHATVLEAFDCNGNNVQNERNNVIEWLQKLGFSMMQERGNSVTTEEESKIKLSFQNEEVIVTLDNNQAANDFLKRLPMETEFQDYAGTEKITYLSERLNISDVPNGMDPKIGDFTYYVPWGNIAVFYKDNGYSNSLVKLGTIESGIEKLSRINGKVSVKIERIA